MTPVTGYQTTPIDHEKIGHIENSQYRGELGALTDDNPQQQVRIGRMTILIDEKLAELEQTIELHRAGNREGSLDLMLTNLGKRLMDDIRRVAQDMKMAESQLLIEREQAADTAIRSATVVTGFGTVLAFASRNQYVRRNYTNLRLLQRNSQ